MITVCIIIGITITVTNMIAKWMPERFMIVLQKGGKMAEYHVGCGFAGIYAGTLNPKGETWRNKSDVTNEAINAVVQYMYFQIPDGDNAFAYGFKMRDGRYVRLKVEASDECPEWAKDVMKGVKND